MLRGLGASVVTNRVSRGGRQSGRRCGPAVLLGANRRPRPPKENVPFHPARGVEWNAHADGEAGADPRPPAPPGFRRRRRCEGRIWRRAAELSPVGIIKQDRSTGWSKGPWRPSHCVGAIADAGSSSGMSSRRADRGDIRGNGRLGGSRIWAPRGEGIHGPPGRSRGFGPISANGTTIDWNLTRRPSRRG